MDKKHTRLWSLSLIIISCVTVIWAVCNLVNIELPDVIVRIMGVLDICAIPVLVYTSIKKRDLVSQKNNTKWVGEKSKHYSKRVSIKIRKVESVGRSERMANIITSIRILCSIALLFCQSLSPTFYLLYLVAGFTDMLDKIDSYNGYSCLALYMDMYYRVNQDNQCCFWICSAE